MRILRKLKSKQGASAVLGILFFLVCFFITSIIMSAASVNISRARTQKEEQKAYLALNAADELIRNEFKKIDFFYAEESIKKHDCHICANEALGLVIGDDTKAGYDSTTDLNMKTTMEGLDEVPLDSSFAAMVEDVAEDILSTKTKFDYSAGPDFDVSTWEKNYDIQAEDMMTVHVHVTADTNYNLYFELYVDTKFAVKHSQTLKVKASVTQNTNSVLSENQCPVVVTADGNKKGHPVPGKFTVDLEGNSHQVYKDYGANTITYQYKVQWNSFTTSKGTLAMGEETTTTHA